MRLASFLLLAAVPSAIAQTWTGVSGSYYSASMNVADLPGLGGMAAAQTGPEHPLSRDWGMPTQVVSTRLDCLTCTGGEQQVSLTVVKSYSSGHAYALGRNVNFALLPTGEADCLNAWDIDRPVVAATIDAAGNSGLASTWHLAHDQDDLLIELGWFTMGGRDHLGSYLEWRLSVRNLSADLATIGLRQVLPLRFIRRPPPRAPAGSLDVFWSTLQEPTAAAEPLFGTEAEWLLPEAALWHATASGERPSVSHPWYFVSGTVQPLPWLGESGPDVQLLQFAAMDEDVSAPVAGGGLTNSCFEWHVSDPPRAVNHLGSMGVAMTWGLTEDSALVIPPGESVTVARQLVSYKNYPLAARINGPFTADCTGADTAVAIDGEAVPESPTSSPFYYEWVSDDPAVTFEDVHAAATTAHVAGAGSHAIRLRVGVGAYEAWAEGTIEVRDSVAPRLELSVTPGELWPPNHRLVPVTVTASLEDDCDASPELRLVSVVSDEPADARGDGRTAPDILGVALGTDDREVLLRAERSGGSWRGRTYTLTYEAVDDAGNVATRSVAVRVGHDLRAPRPTVPRGRP